MKEATEGDCGKVSRQLSPQAINTVVAFSVVSPEIKQAIESVKYIAENMRSRNKAKEVKGFLFTQSTQSVQHIDYEKIVLFG